jgi:hypothetical protein
LNGLQPSPSAHVSDPFKALALTWEDFVQLVFRLTVQAYRAMHNAGIARPNWEENVFTVNLQNFLRPIAFNQELPVHVHSRIKHHTGAMRAGVQPTIEAKEMDLVLYGSWEQDYHEVCFVWEAKRVGDKRVNKHFGVLNAAYINEAIYRFILCKYAAGLDDAGVLAYVLAGNAEVIVEDINATMGRIRKNPRLPDNNHLTISSPIDGFENVYLSTHTRIDSSSIQLHHLFFSFDFT